KSKLDQLVDQGLKAFQSAKDSKELYDIKVQFLGKQGSVSLIMREMASLPKEERPAFGQSVNQAKNQLEAEYETQLAKIKAQELNEQIARERLHLSLPGPKRRLGTAQPITLVAKEIVQILSRIGYSVRTGPMIEKDWFNLEALNIPPDHHA